MRSTRSAFLVLVMVAAAHGGEIEDEIAELRSEIEEISTAMLSKNIEAYLEETSTAASLQGGESPLEGVSLHARFLSNFIASVGQSSPAADIGVVGGLFEMDFDFQVTESLEIFVDVTANTAPAGTLPASFPATGIAAPGGATLSGLYDGIGVDGNVPIKPGSFVTQQVGMRVRTGQFNLELGELNPRDRFLGNAYGRDPQRQFINNSFDDPASIPWLTDSTGRISLGAYGWWGFGEDDNGHTISLGWFNTPGMWFSNGQFYMQWQWSGTAAGGEMNIRIMGFVQSHPAFTSAVDTQTAGGGFSWDWAIGRSKNWGVFFTFNGNGQDVNPVNTDLEIGVVLRGVGSRVDDRVGLAVAFLSPNLTVLPGAENETTVELYWTVMLEDANLQVTPYFQYVRSPGGGVPTGIFTNGQDLYLLGLRIFVPF